VEVAVEAEPAAGAAPRSIRQAGPGHLEIVWGDGHVSTYPVAYLRLACRCAACIDERTGARILDPASVPKDVKPLRIDPVGRYAIHFTWSDGHSSGIYSFEHLRAICPCEACRGQG
jgi:ATP-binding protein involved in chromosome partitioning